MSFNPAVCRDVTDFAVLTKPHESVNRQWDEVRAGDPA